MPTVKYEGQPEAVIGFFVELWEPWVKIVEGDEWGDLLYSLLSAAEMAESASDHELTLFLCRYIEKDLIRAREEGFWDDYVEGRHPKAILDAQANYTRVVERWRERAKGFNGNTPENASVTTDRLEEYIAGLPEWVKPQEQNRLLEIEMATLEEDNRQAQRQINKRNVRIEEIIVALDGGETD